MLKKGQYEMAIKDYDKALELSPNNAQAYINRELVYKKKGRL